MFAFKSPAATQLSLHPVSLFAIDSRISSHRTLVGFVKNALGIDPPPLPTEPVFANRFYPWDESPSPAIRERAARIKAQAKCPVTGKEIRFTCPLSGIPTHYSKEAWENDTNYHKNKIYEKLRKVNIYEHDLRSGRPFPEFDFPGEQARDSTVNMTNWDLFFYTRQFYSMDTEFQLATVTKMLSYPITIGSILYKYSPYNLIPKGPVTLEGLKSLAALRYTLRNNAFATTKTRPMRIFILGARAESQLPIHIWKQLQFLFPAQAFEINFIGPECSLLEQDSNYLSSDSRIVKRVDESLTLAYYPDYFDKFHKAQDFFPYCLLYTSRCV